jgi:hypothetical protein
MGVNFVYGCVRDLEIQLFNYKSIIDAYGLGELHYSK